MRHPKATMLAVAFSLLASAATAYTECAWVLWTYTMLLGSSEERWQ